MSIQYKDGSFSDNMPINEAFDKFKEEVEKGTARSLHVGSERELDALKEEKRLADELKTLSERLDALEAGPTTSEIVVIPTRDEILLILRGDKWPQ